MIRKNLKNVFVIAVAFFVLSGCQTVDLTRYELVELEECVENELTCDEYFKKNKDYYNEKCGEPNTTCLKGIGCIIPDKICKIKQVFRRIK